MQRSNEIINNVDEEDKDDDGVGLLCRLRKRASFGKESLLAPPSLPPRARRLAVCRRGWGIVCMQNHVADERAGK